MTRARARALHDKVNSLLATLDLDDPLDGILPHASVLCLLSCTTFGAVHAGRDELDETVAREEEDGAHPGAGGATADGQRYHR